MVELSGAPMDRHHGRWLWARARLSGTRYQARAAAHSSRARGDCAFPAAAWNKSLWRSASLGRAGQRCNDRAFDAQRDQPSLLYALVTLGPIFLLLPAME